ncbi:hypothetical protein AB0J28_01730, partial [Streptosporangium canum]|uniref:hypothetical protein n=1 Tax=Streptosporangium canum TaxID=324952 RepID=UPI003447CA84
RLLQEYAKLPRPTADELLDTLLGDISTPTSSPLTRKENAVTLTSALHTEAAGSQPTPPLTDAQLDGIACVRCGATNPPMVPTGHGPRGQMFACSPACPTP